MVDATGQKGAADRAVARVLAASATLPNAASTSPARDDPAQNGPTRNSAASVDVVRLSNVAADLAAKPPVNAERVQQIKRAIANGTFPILPATIADRLLAVRYEWMSDDAQ